MNHTQAQRKLLVLDIDETLVFATERTLDGVEPDFQIGPYRVHKRPHLDNFIAKCARLFDIALWTAGSSRYASAISHNIIEPHCQPIFVWSRERCTVRMHDRWRAPVMVKDFKKVKRQGFDLTQVIVVDNSPEKHIRNWGNLVAVEDFVGSQHDDELLLLSHYLASLANEPNIRTIDKRRWRLKMNNDRA